MKISTSAWVLGAAVFLGCGGGNPPLPLPEADGGTEADAGSFAIERQLGGGADDMVLDVTGDAEGNLYIAGFTNGLLGTENVEPAGDAQAFVLKIDPAGRASRLAAVQTDQPDVYEALLLQGGALYAAGRSAGSLSGHSNQGRFDALLTRVDLGSGRADSVQWGDARSQQPRSVFAFPDGSVGIAGFNDVYVPSNYVEAWEDPTLAVVGISGTTLSLTVDLRLDSARPDVFYAGAAARDGSGDVFVAGSSGGSLAVTGAFVQRMRKTGEQVWRRVLSRTGADAVTGVFALEDGRVLVGGTTFTALGPAYGQQDAFAAWLDAATGDVLQVGQAGSAESDWVADMAVDARGHVFLAGDTLGAVAGAQRGEQDPFVVELDASGRWVGRWQNGTPAYDEVRGVHVDPHGRVWVVGSTEGELAGRHHGRRDGFLVEAQLETVAPLP